MSPCAALHCWRALFADTGLGWTDSNYSPDFPCSPSRLFHCWAFSSTSPSHPPVISTVDHLPFERSASPCTYHLYQPIWALFLLPTFLSPLPEPIPSTCRLTQGLLAGLPHYHDSPPNPRRDATCPITTVSLPHLPLIAPHLSLPLLNHRLLGAPPWTLFACLLIANSVAHSLLGRSP